tara:strand:+ start:482 stop:1204 length:723 start_codon:yes stop_codon:yes gene_type:complete
MSGITLSSDPANIMRYNQSFYPVPEEFKTSGQYYKDLGEELFQIFDEECYESGVGAARAEKRLDNFRYTLRNIEYGASSVIRKFYLRYKLKYRLRTGPCIKAIRHNGVNYSSVLYLLLKQRWENYMKDKTDSILNYTCERVTEKINRQRSAVLIQRNFRRFSAELNYEYIRWVEHLKEQQRNRTVAESIEYYWAGWKKREEAKERDERELMKAEDRIEMEAERDAQLEEDMGRMREMYFD